MFSSFHSIIVKMIDGMERRPLTRGAASKEFFLARRQFEGIKESIFPEFVVVFFCLVINLILE